MSEDALRRLQTEPCFEEMTFESLEATGLDLTGKEFTRCVFRRVRLPESRWKLCRLEDCRFEECDLTRMDPMSLLAAGVQFHGCKLLGVDWSALGRNPVLSFESCDLRFASFVKLHLNRLSMKNCRTTGANFLQCHLTGADFDGTELTGTRFEGNDLTRADFSGAAGLYLDPKHNRTKGTRISVESAVLLAQAAGLHVAGYSE